MTESLLRPTAYVSNPVQSTFGRFTLIGNRERGDMAMLNKNDA